MLYRFQLRSSATDAAPKVSNEGGGGRGTLGDAQGRSREQSWASPGKDEDSPVGDRGGDCTETTAAAVKGGSRRSTWMVLLTQL